ncbi:hypothetical protein G6011_06738 [Alternaria panax]|uniref:Major facilitator superfamily (MFS) profile domain-containing protein n=1 Tax=Alternaria panax TaxID=48097 RepID=A0AAD4I5R4_9PLEO|nr:hypothetical protein G6011_06738 [Alternaria panax]
MAWAIFVVGGTIQIAGVVIGMLYAGRFIAGFGVGFLIMIIPIYQAEITHRRIRRKLDGLRLLPHLDRDSDNCEWRIPLAVQIIPALFLGSLIYMFPESSRWLCDHDRAGEGLRNLALLHAHADISDPYVLAEFDVIQAQIRAGRLQKKKETYLNLVRNWPNLRRTLLACFIQAECQMTGVSAIQYFSPQVYAQIGITSSQFLLFNGINAIIAFLGTFVCILTIDRIGRRPLEIYVRHVLDQRDPYPAIPGIRNQ